MNRKSTKQGVFYRFIATVLLIFSFILFTEPCTIYADNGDTVVHITSTGSCYHREGCYHLQSDIEVTLYEAEKDGYQPCDDCNPPIYDGPPIEDASPQKPKSINHGTLKQSGTISTDQISNPAAVSIALEKEQTESVFREILLFAVLFLLFVAPTLCIIVSVIGSAREARKKRKREKEEFETERQKYYEMYANVDPLTLVDVPEGVFLKDGYPCTANGKMGIWGDYTVYVAQKNRRVFHMKPRCGKTNLVPLNYYQACRLPHCKKCAVGKIKLPELDWYIEYLKITDIKKKYNIQ